MAQLPSPVVDVTVVAEPLAVNDDFDKIENGNTGVTATPKGSAAYPERT
ncbi:hypothetical protein PC121_g24210, partial [Phytophthora cactorum]